MDKINQFNITDINMLMLKYSYPDFLFNSCYTMCPREYDLFTSFVGN